MKHRNYFLEALEHLIDHPAGATPSKIAVETEGTFRGGSKTTPKESRQ